MQIGMDLEDVNFAPRPVCFMFCTENTKILSPQFHGTDLICK